jgi:MFS family permease
MADRATDPCVDPVASTRSSWSVLPARAVALCATGNQPDKIADHNARAAFSSVGFCAAVIAAIITGTAADFWSRGLQFSTREGAAGYWVMMALLGAIAGLEEAVQHRVHRRRRADVIGGLVIVASWPLRLMVGRSDWYFQIGEAVARVANRMFG